MSSLVHPLVQQQADQKAVTGLPAYTHRPRIHHSSVSNVPFLLLLLVQFGFTTQCKELKSKASWSHKQIYMLRVWLTSASLRVGLTAIVRESQFLPCYTLRLCGCCISQLQFCPSLI